MNSPTISPYVAIICTAERLPLHDEGGNICFNLNLSTAVVGDVDDAFFTSDVQNMLLLYDAPFAQASGNFLFDAFVISASVPAQKPITGTAKSNSNWAKQATPCCRALQDLLGGFIANNQDLLKWDPANPSGVTASSSHSNAASKYTPTPWYNTLAHASTWPKPIPQGLNLSFEVSIPNSSPSPDHVLIFPRFQYGGSNYAASSVTLLQAGSQWQSYEGDYSLNPVSSPTPATPPCRAYQTPCPVTAQPSALFNPGTYWVNPDPSASGSSTSNWRQTLEATIAARFDYFPRLLNAIETAYGSSAPPSPLAAQIWSLGINLLQNLSDYGNRALFETSFFQSGPLSPTIQSTLIQRAIEGVEGYRAPTVPNHTQIYLKFLSASAPTLTDWNTQINGLLTGLDQNLAKYIGLKGSAPQKTATTPAEAIAVLRQLYAVLSNDTNLQNLLLNWWNPLLQSGPNWPNVQSQLQNQILPKAQLHKRYLSAIAANPDGGTIKQSLNTLFPGRSGHTAVLAGTPRQMVVFGGDPGTGKPLGDVWMMAADANSGQPWIPLTPTGPSGFPSPRSGHSAVFDSTAGKMLVFGGSDGTQPLNELWSLIIPNPAPVPLSISPSSNPVVAPGSGSPALVGLTLTLSGRGFIPASQVLWNNSPRATTFISPSKITAAILDSDLESAGTGLITVQNPAPGGGTSATLAFIVGPGSGEGSPAPKPPTINFQSLVPEWMPVKPALTSPPEPWPSPRVGHTAVYNSRQSAMIVFGGDGTSDVWVLKNAASASYEWVKIQAAPAPAPAPVPRSFHSAVYDQDHDEMIVFGGLDAGNNALSDAWLLSGITAPGSPAVAHWSPLPSDAVARCKHSAIYDPSSKGMLIFGGYSTQPLNDLRLLKNAIGTTSPPSQPAWTPVTASGNIAGKYGHTAVYDEGLKLMIAFSGQPAPFADVWALDGPFGATPPWTKLSLSGYPQLDAAVKAAISGWVRSGGSSADVDAIVTADLNDPSAGLAPIVDDSPAPEKRPHPVVIQVGAWDTDQPNTGFQPNPGTDLRRVAGVGMLIRKSGPPPSPWRCLNATDITLTYTEEASPHSTTVTTIPDVFAPIRIQYRNGIKDPFVTYDNHPLIAQSPATKLQGWFQAGSWSPNTAYPLNAEVMDSAGHVQKCTQAGTSGLNAPTWNSGGATNDPPNTPGGVVWQDQGPAVNLFGFAPASSIYGSIYGLVFGTVYDFAPFVIGHGGAMPSPIENALNGSPSPSEITDPVPASVIRQVAYYRRVPIGHVRVLPPQRSGDPVWKPNAKPQWTVIPPNVYPLARDLGLTGSGSPAQSGAIGDNLPLLLLPFQAAGVTFRVFPPSTDINTWDRWVADGSVYDATSPPTFTNTLFTRKAVWAAFHRDAQALPASGNSTANTQTNPIGDPAVSALLFRLESCVTLGSPTPLPIELCELVSYSKAGAGAEDSSAIAWASVSASPIVITVKEGPFDLVAGGPPNSLTITVPSGEIVRLTVTPLVITQQYNDRFEPNIFLTTNPYIYEGISYESVGVNYQALGTDAQSSQEFVLLIECPTSQPSPPLQLTGPVFDSNSRTVSLTANNLSMFRTVGEFEIRRQDWRWLGRPLPALPPAAAWQAQTGYTYGMIVTDLHGNQQVCTQTGISGGDPPEWNSSSGTSPIDGSVTWTDLGKRAWQAYTSYQKGDTVNDPSGHLRTCTTAGTSGAAAPTWVKGGPTKESTGVVWSDLGIRNWQPGAAYARGYILNDPQGHQQQCTQTGTSGPTAPNWNDAGGSSPMDGSVTWASSTLARNDWESMAFADRLPSDFKTSYARFSATPTNSLELISIDLSKDLRCQYIRFLVIPHNRYENMPGFTTATTAAPTTWPIYICVPRATQVPVPAKPLLRLVAPIVNRNGFDLVGVAHETWYQLGGLGETLVAKIQPVLSSKVTTVIFSGSPASQEPIEVEDFGGDNGVTYFDSGTPLQLVTTSPPTQPTQAGTYQVVPQPASSPANPTARYLFAPADNGKNVVISYLALDPQHQQLYEFGPDQIVDGTAAQTSPPQIVLQPIGATLASPGTIAPNYSNTYFKGAVIGDDSSRISWNQFKVQFRRELRPYAGSAATGVLPIVSDWTDAMWIQTIPDSDTFKTASGVVRAGDIRASWKTPSPVTSPPSPVPLIFDPVLEATGPSSASPSDPLFELWYVVTQNITDAFGNPAEVYVPPDVPAGGNTSNPQFSLTRDYEYSVRIVEVQIAPNPPLFMGSFDSYVLNPPELTKPTDEPVRVVRISPPILIDVS